MSKKRKRWGITGDKKSLALGDKCKRRPYSSEFEAQLSMLRMKGDFRPTRSYFCNHCGQFHVTNQPKFNTK